MKSKIKSLVFWAAFFFLLVCLMFFGILVLIVNDLLAIEYYADLLYSVFCAVGYLFIALYLIFSILTLLNKFPEKIKRFEKFRYLGVMILLIITEMIVIASALPDLD